MLNVITLSVTISNRWEAEIRINSVLNLCWGGNGSVIIKHALREYTGHLHHLKLCAFHYLGIQKPFAQDVAALDDGNQNLGVTTCN